MTAPARSTLALDIGGTKLAVAVVDPDGSVHGLQIAPTRKEDGPDAVVARLFGLAREAVAEAAREIAAVGISCGGPLDAEAGTVSPLNLPGWHDVPLGPL